MKKNSGFTIVELMIVTAIVGLLSTIAVSAYASYVTSSKTSVVTAHYDDAQRFVRFKYALAAAQTAQGAAPDPAVPNDAAGWIAIISESGSSAPDGGPTYVPGPGDPATGAIGIQVSGTFVAGDSVVTITRPAYGGLPADVAVLTQGT